MSDKKLLNENTIRRFMKLAAVDTLTDNFISEMGYGNKAYAKDDDEPVEESNLEAEDNIVTEEEEEEEQMDLEMDMGEVEDADDDDMEDMDEGADISLSEEEANILIELGERLRAAMGSDMGAPDEDEPVGDMEAPEDEMPPAGDDLDAMPDEEEDEEDDAPLQEDIVQEVLKRVTKRIIREKMASK